MHNMTIQGQRVNRTIARLRYKCIQCLAPLKNKNFGLVCAANNQHYGFIHRGEADKLTQEERFMNIGDMFPSDYLRGIDVARPFVATIKAVEAEEVLRHETQKNETEYVMYFEEISKKLRLNKTMTMECATIFSVVDTGDLVGKKVTIYRTDIKAFGKDHIVPRIRKVEKDDEPLNAPKAITDLDKVEFFNKVKSELDVPVKIASRTLLEAGLVNGDGYQPDRAEEYWTAIKLTGRVYWEFVQQMDAQLFALDQDSIIQWFDDHVFDPDRLDEYESKLTEYDKVVADQVAANGS